MKKFSATVLALLLLLTALNAQVQAPQPSTITLDQALSIAFERNVSIAVASNNADIAKAGVVTAYGSYVPQLVATADFNRQGFSAPPTTRINFFGLPELVPRTDTWNNTYKGTVGLTYNLFDGFNRESNFSSAKTNESQAMQTYERTRQSTAYSVMSAYLAVLLNDQQVKVFQENLANQSKQLDRITEQNRLGAVAIGDVYRQQSLVAQAEYNLISGQNTFDKSKADLLNLLALDVNQNYVIADPTIATQIKQVESDSGVQSLGPFGDLLARALDARPDYKSSEENVTLADLSITQAWSTYYPSLSVNAGYGMNQLNWTAASSWVNHYTSVGLNLSWQLPEIFGAMQRIQTANIQKKNAQLQVQQMQRDISVELKKALLDLEAARKQYVASQKSQIAAGQDRKTAEAKYNLGSGTLLDLQVADAAYLTAELTTLSNAYTYMALKKNLDLVLGEKQY